MVLEKGRVYEVITAATGFWPRSMQGKVLDSGTRLKFLGWPDPSPRFRIVGGDLNGREIELLSVQSYLREVAE